MVTTSRNVSFPKNHSPTFFTADQNHWNTQPMMENKSYPNAARTAYNRPSTRIAPTILNTYLIITIPTRNNHDTPDTRNLTEQYHHRTPMRAPAPMPALCTLPAPPALSTMHACVQLWALYAPPALRTMHACVHREHCTHCPHWTQCVHAYNCGHCTHCPHCAQCMHAYNCGHCTHVYPVHDARMCVQGERLSVLRDSWEY